MIKITSKIKKIIEKNPIAFATVNFATVNKDSKPNVIAVAFVKVVSNNRVLISDVCMKQTKENLKRNNNVCLAVWDKNWDGYKLIGTAKYFSEGKWKKFVEKMPDNKNSPPKGAILITISRLIKLG